MRFVELFEDSKEQKELKTLVKKTNNNQLLSQIVNYLKSKAAAAIPQEKSSQKTIATEDVSNLKSQALDLINQLEDPEELDKLISFLRRSEISDLSKRVIVKQLGSIQGGIDKKLAALLTRIKNPFDEKIQFLNKILQQGGLFDGASLLANKSGNIYNLISNDPIASAIAKTLADQFRGTMGYGPDQGPGEFMLILLGKGVELASKGDLSIGNNSIEVKATKKGTSGFAGGRLLTTTGYGRATSVKKILYPMMIDAGIPADVLQQYGWPNKEAGQKTIPGGINLNISGLKNLSELFKQYVSRDDAANIIKTMLDSLYTKMPDGMYGPILDLIQADGSFDNKKFLVEKTKLAHKYYQFVEGHDTLMLFNIDNGNYVMIQDANDFDNFFASGKVALTSHLDWNDDRAAGSSQIIVK